MAKRLAAERFDSLQMARHSRPEGEWTGMKRAPEKLLKALQEAESLQAANKISKAAQAGRQAYALAAEYLPGGHPERRRAARVLGLLLMNLNQKGEAERLLLESGDLVVDGDLESQMAARNTHAGLRLQQGVSDEVVVMVLENLKFAREHLPPESVGVILALANAGKLAEAGGDMKAAERFFSEALSLTRPGQDQQLLVGTLLDLARIHLRGERISKCEPLYREALQIQEASGDQDIALAINLNQYGAVCHKLGRTEEATRHLERSLELRRSILGADHAQVATAMHGLARVYLDSSQDQKAEEILEQAWRITDRALGPDHPKTLQYLVERATCIMGQGPQRALEGLKLVRRADKLSAQLSPHDPTRRQVLNFLNMCEQLYAKMHPAQ